MANKTVDAVLGVDASTDSLLCVGQCDIIVQGLSEGAVKLQYLLPKTVALTSPAWVDFPDGSFIVDTYKTIFISEHGVKLRLTGVSNNDTVYVKIAKHLIR
jgi:hypothetical protein